MNDKYEIFEFNICTFKIKDEGVALNTKEFPKRRVCVVDNERKKVIDINQELEYDYIETLSHLYFINESRKKIKENKRAAIFPIMLLSLTMEQKEKANNIISMLENGHKFLDGNEELSNEEYLESLRMEELREKAKVKRKGFFKRKK